MVDAAASAGRTLMIQFNNRFRPGANPQGYADDGVFGDVYFARCGWIRRNGIPGWGGWFTQAEMAGGGPLIDLAVHMLDLTMWLMGNPEPEICMASTYSVFGPKMEALGPWGTPNPKGKFDVEDMAVGMIKFAGGQTIMLEASWAARIKREWVYSTLCGTQAGASLERVFAVDGVDDSAVDTLELYPGAGRGGGPRGEGQADPAMGATPRCGTSWTACSAASSQSARDRWARLMKIIDAMCKSAASGRAVAIK